MLVPDAAVDLRSISEAMIGRSVQHAPEQGNYPPESRQPH